MCRVLARITAALADAGANIDEVHHQRAFTTLTAQNADIELGAANAHPAHVDEVLEHLRSVGDGGAHGHAVRQRFWPPRNRILPAQPTTFGRPAMSDTHTSADRPPTPWRRWVPTCPWCCRWWAHRDVLLAMIAVTMA